MRRKSYKGKLELWNFKGKVFLCLLKSETWYMQQNGADKMEQN